jgi:hypothetical protein
LATSVTDDLGNTRSCTPWANFNTSNPQPGLYCSTTPISLPNNKSLTAAGGFGFVAPSIGLANGQVYRGYSQLYGAYGGMFAYAYNGDVNSSGSGTGFRGAIFAPLGDVSLSGSGSSAVCDAGVGGCGFIEALTISLTGSNAHWQGLGPGFGGGTTTTTTPGTTVTTPGSTVTTPGTTTTIPGSTNPATTTTIPGTTNPPTTVTNPDVVTTVGTGSGLDE